MRNYELYIEDIKEAIEKIFTYIAPLDINDFIKDVKTYESVLLNLFIIGEAADKINITYS